MGTSRLPPQAGQATVRLTSRAFRSGIEQVDGLIAGLGIFWVHPLGHRAIRAVRAFRHAVLLLAVLEAVAQFPQQGHARDGIGCRADDGLGHAQDAGSRFANDLAVALLRQLQAVLLVLDDDQPFEPFIEVGDLVLAGLERMVTLRVRHAVQFVRPFLAGVAALGALPLVVLPADPLLELAGVESCFDHEGQPLFHRPAAALLQEAGPGDLALAPPVARRLGRRRARHFDHVALVAVLVADQVGELLAGFRALRRVVLAATRFIGHEEPGQGLRAVPFVHHADETFVGEELDLDTVKGEAPQLELALDVRDAGLRADPPHQIDARLLNHHLGGQGLARAHFGPEYLVVVRQAGVGHVRLMRHESLRHAAAHQRPVLVTHQRPVEPGVDVFAAEITDLETVALAVVHRPDLDLGVLALVVVAVEVRAAHGLDFRHQPVARLRADLAVPEIDAAVLSLQQHRHTNPRAAGCLWLRP